MLCYQGEYAGAINLIIPVLEAILANYVSGSTGDDLRGSDRYKEIKKMPYYVTLTMLNQYKESFRSAGYNPQQCKYLEQLTRKRLENWHFILEDFLQNGLFRYISPGDSPQDMNRHAILHLFHPYPYHTLSNYIIMFNTLKMLSWIFAQIEKTSILINIDAKLLLEKVNHYETLITKSKDLQVTKHILLREYQLHNDVDLKQNLRHTGINSLRISTRSKLLLLLKRKTDCWISKLQLGRTYFQKRKATTTH